jgi:hypothetical protein
MFTLSKEALIFLAVAGAHRPNIDVLKIKSLVIHYILRKEKGKEKHYRYHKARCCSIIEFNFKLKTPQRTNTENSKQIFPFPEKELRGHSPNFHIHVSVSDLYIPTIDLPILVVQEICRPVLGI